MAQEEWEFFISHASEDKEEIALPIANRLKKIGYKVWLDELILKVGDRLSSKINEGLAHSKYGIVILSPNFLAKEWPQRELAALFAREDTGKKVILPIWHNINSTVTSSRLKFN